MTNGRGCPLQIVVLGKIAYALDDARGTAVVTNSTIDSVASLVRDAISVDLELTAHSSDTYRRGQALRDGDGREILETALPSELKAVKRLQVGVYHHRVVLIFDIDADSMSLGRIRQMRKYATDYCRRVFDDVAEASAGEGTIKTIVAFPVLLVPSGTRLLREEDSMLVKEGYSHLYSTTTTTFGIEVRASRIPGDWRKHFIRVSVPGIIIYQAGSRLTKSLLNAIVDAVYYGALYSRAEIIAVPSPNGRDAEPTERGEAATPEMTLGTNDYLREVVDMLRDRVATERRYEFEMTVMVLSLVATGIAAIVAAVALVLK